MRALRGHGSSSTHLAVACFVLLLSAACAASGVRPEGPTRSHHDVFRSDDARDTSRVLLMDDQPVPIALDTAWVARARGVGELERLRPGTRVGLLLRDGARLEGIYQGLGPLPAAARVWDRDEWRRRGYTGPGFGDSLRIHSVRGEWLRGRFYGLLGNSVWMELPGDSLPRACDLRLVGEIWCRGVEIPKDSLAAWSGPGRVPDTRGVWLSADAASAAPAAPIAVPWALVEACAELQRPTLPGPSVRSVSGGFVGGVLVGGFTWFVAMTVGLSAVAR